MPFVAGAFRVAWPGLFECRRSLLINRVGYSSAARCLSFARSSSSVPGRFCDLFSPSGPLYSRVGARRYATASATRPMSACGSVSPAVSLLLAQCSSQLGRDQCQTASSFSLRYPVNRHTGLGLLSPTLVVCPKWHQEDHSISGHCTFYPREQSGSCIAHVG